MLEVLGIIVGVLAVTGVLLNNRMKIACFFLWIISNSMSAYIHSRTGPWSLYARDVVFYILAVEGLWLWRKKRGREAEKTQKQDPTCGD